MNRYEFNYRFPLSYRVTIGIALLFGVLYALFFIGSTTEEPEPTPLTLAQEIRSGSAPRPEYTEATRAKLEKGPLFHALVSYTDDHFEPAVVRIQKGQTVRFTNNSSNDVWIAANGANVQIYPRTKAVCGSSDLDSCEPFAPQDFWQFTFDIAGEWEIVNNLEKSKGGRVIVE